jgi:hypothetical protein
MSITKEKKNSFPAISSDKIYNDVFLEFKNANRTIFCNMQNKEILKLKNDLFLEIKEKYKLDKNIEYPRTTTSQKNLQSLKNYTLEYLKSYFEGAENLTIPDNNTSNENLGFNYNINENEFNYSNLSFNNYSKLPIKEEYIIKKNKDEKINEELIIKNNKKLNIENNLETQIIGIIG